MEPITVIFQTYRRTDYAIRTIVAARELLRYDGPLEWYIADDGSDREHFYTVMGALEGVWIGAQSKRRGYGANANAAWDAAQSQLTFWLEDDFQLKEPLDLTPHAYTLMECESVAMVRLGYIDGSMLETPSTFCGRRYHTIPRDWPDTSFYAFTGHPSLRHARYRAFYGNYPEGMVPGDTELYYAYKYRVGSGPLIVWPVGYPPAGLWDHIGEIKTETML